MAGENAQKVYDQRSGLWYYVRWDDESKSFVWTIAPYQQLIKDSEPPRRAS
jgi:hypothetical protein